MFKNHEKFYSSDGKRTLLIAEDEEINREMLGMILEDDFQVIYAENGEIALAKAEQYREQLSLVLLDLLMPVMSGQEVLRRMKENPLFRTIPVIVLTADSSAEVESLNLGAIDYIPKPYPQAEIIKARIQRAIELSEDRDIIAYTERDPLTDLYNRDYFYRFAEQFDLHHKEMEMDAIVVDINHFHMINERFGTTYGDELLRGIAEKLRAMVSDSDGIVCRREADNFMVYCPHRNDYQAILDTISADMTGLEPLGRRINLRMGVYANVDKSLEIVRRFDRANIAANTVRSNFSKLIGIYDDELHQQELFHEQLVEMFPQAIRDKQFKVYYQPKFDIQADIPVLAGAEALVRWQHPEKGLISPGVFIPLFERNGLIQELDSYVWQEAAAQVRDWKTRIGIAVPLSVNVSRIDLYHPNLTGTLSYILRTYSIAPEELHLEITESVYTQDSEQIIRTVGELRAMGFRIEMDDFGTGYSSLNMISKLPIDVLKIDMQFVRSAFARQKDTHMLEVIIDIADHLRVPVIAEGVETAEQVETLRSIKCEQVQGYYFSKPVRANDFDRFLLERKAQMENAAALSPQEILPTEEQLLEAERQSAATYASIAKALARDYFSIYYVNTETNHFIEYSSFDDYRDLGIEKRGDDFFNLSRENIRRVAHPDDIENFLSSFTKENILKAKETSGVFTLTYRLIFDGKPTFVHMKATCMEDKDDPHIVIGVSNIDEQMQREQAQLSALHSARELANRDPLTGVKSKHAFMESKNNMEVQIADGTISDFAIAVCDVNGLKEINDNQGHEAGDILIKEASSVICRVFAHSPVYRYGGDEFVVILTGSDYESRENLMNHMAQINKSHCENGGVMIACGLSEFQALNGESFSEVFSRADTAMYDNKMALKGSVKQ